MFESTRPSCQPPTTASQYAGGMAVSAHDVARALRARLPGIGSIKLQKLLYYCQGHHLAATEGEPLFAEALSAWDNGPVVGTLWYAEKNGEPAPPASDLTEAQLNTIGYVCSRYGGLTSNDLINMSHQETPWKRANADRAPGHSARIDPEWLYEYFTGEGAAVDEEIPVAPEHVKELLAAADARRGQPGHPDSVEHLLERIRQLSA